MARGDVVAWGHGSRRAQERAPHHEDRVLARTRADVAFQPLTYFLSCKTFTLVKPAKTLPWSSTATSSAEPSCGSSGMKAVTLPSLALPMRMPCLKPGLVFSSDWESLT